MATYILLTKLSSESLGDLRKRETIGRKWLKSVKEKCPEVKWVDHYALLGPFDFMDIFEAPDEEVAAKVSRGFSESDLYSVPPIFNPTLT